MGVIIKLKISLIPKTSYIIHSMTDLDLQKKGIMLQNQNNGPIIQK